MTYVLCDDSSTVCNNWLFLDCFNCGWWLYPLIVSVSAKGILFSQSLPRVRIWYFTLDDKNPIKTDRVDRTTKRENRNKETVSERTNEIRARRLRKIWLVSAMTRLLAVLYRYSIPLKKTVTTMNRPIVSNVYSRSLHSSWRLIKKSLGGRGMRR